MRCSNARASGSGCASVERRKRRQLSRAVLATAAVLLCIAPSVAAHGPKTAEEVAAFHARQQGVYHCAPAVAAMTQARKRSWAQKVLGVGGDASNNRPESNTYIDGYFEQHAQEVKQTQTAEQEEEKRRKNGKRLMECYPETHTAIRNSTCVLAPEVTPGPYYHTSGHPIRNNMAEWQLGLPFVMNVGVIDVETCKPVPNVLVDLWHANATGFYAGHNPKPEEVVARPATQGVRKGLLPAFKRTDDTATWLRGAWPTDQNGVAQFTSVFPGYYTGRATHVHLKVHPEWRSLPNGTFESRRLVHTGQFFVDDLLNEEIDKLQPYSENPIRHLSGRGRTRNWEDSLHIFDEAHRGGYMPTFDVEPLGMVLSQGLVGFVTVGVNMTANFESVWHPNMGTPDPVVVSKKDGPRSVEL